VSELEIIWAPKLEGTLALEYDRFVLDSPSGHFAQTRAWARVAEASRFRRARYFVAREAGRVVGAALVLRGALGPARLPFAEVERGPVCRESADVPRVVGALATVARRHGIARLSVMPYFCDDVVGTVEEALRTTRFRDVQRPDGAHAATLRIDLDGASDDAILAGAARAPARRLAREATRAGATVRAGTRADLDVHRELVRRRLASEGRRDRPPSFYEALWAWLEARSGGAFFVCEHAGTIVGTVIAARHGRIATYAHGATLPGPCAFSKSILPLLAAIRWARVEGSTQFDLGGVPLDEDEDPKRAAIAHYKRHFSRTRVRLVREHARWF
jgi:lipid II:glycine glycyltransferase (peptidoglycan interpeptide bridge formation enzyme)